MAVGMAIPEDMEPASPRVPQLGPQLPRALTTLIIRRRLVAITHIRLGY